MRSFGVLMRLCGLLVSGGMVSLRMMLCCCMMCLCSVFMVFRCLLVCVVCHGITSLEAFIDFIAENTRLTHGNSPAVC